MGQIELDNIRLENYQQLKTNLVAVAEHFRHGDILVKQVNSILSDVKNSIDNGLETSFTQQDFNDMLDIRNSVLAPIFQNASFAVEFIPYNGEPITPIILEITTPVDTIKNNIIDGVLFDSTLTTTSGTSVIKTIKTMFGSGQPTEIITIEYLEDNKIKTTTVKFYNGLENYNVVSVVYDNTIEVTKSNYELNVLVSTTYTKYVNGVITETTTTPVN